MVHRNVWSRIRLGCCRDNNGRWLRVDHVQRAPEKDTWIQSITHFGRAWFVRRRGFMAQDAKGDWYSARILGVWRRHPLDASIGRQRLRCLDGQQSWYRVQSRTHFPERGHWRKILEFQLVRNGWLGCSDHGEWDSALDWSWVTLLHRLRAGCNADAHSTFLQGFESKSKHQEVHRSLSMRRLQPQERSEDRSSLQERSILVREPRDSCV